MKNNIYRILIFKTVNKIKFKNYLKLNNHILLLYYIITFITYYYILYIILLHFQEDFFYKKSVMMQNILSSIFSIELYFVNHKKL